MPATLHVSIPDEMHRYIQSRTDGRSLHATPSEYVRDLIRRDIEASAAVEDLWHSVQDMKAGRFSAKSLDDYIDDSLSG